MQIQEFDVIKNMVQGRIGFSYIFPDHVQTLFSKPNQIQYGWAAAVTKLLAGHRGYAINGMYIEFENMTLPGDAATIPSFDRSEGIEYFQDLSFSSVRDFLRVPLLVNPSIGIHTGYDNYFVEGVSGNKLTFFTQSKGIAGYHGRTWSDSVNSKVVGVALIVMPELDDATKDIVFARSYLEVAEQTLKLPSSQVGVTWDISLL